MSFQVVHADPRQAARERHTLRDLEPDQERADEAGTPRDRDGVDGVDGVEAASRAERSLDDLDDLGDVLA